MPIEPSGKTSREVIAEIRNEKGNPIIHFVERAYNSEDFVYLPIPSCKYDAAMYMNGLLPYLRSVYGKKVDKCFTLAAIKQAKGAKWDVSKGGMVTKMDEELENFEDDDDAFNFTKSAAPKKTAPLPKRKEQEDDDSTKFSLDDGTIETVRSERQQRKPSRSASDSTKSSKRSKGSTSSITMASMNQQFMKMSNKFNFIMDQLAQLGMANTQANQNNKESSGNSTTAGGNK